MLIKQMKAIITHNDTHYTTDLSNPIDISIPLRAAKTNVNAWYLPPPVITPLKGENFTGSVAEGGPVNFNSISFNPHAHGTHTECAGHITKEFYSINNTLKQFFFIAELISISPEKSGDDEVITEKQLKSILGDKTPEALVIRTLPNTPKKLSRQYSHTNPPYLTESAAAYLKEKEIQHLLIDLPSVDKEKDDGKLRAHNAFWNTDGELRTKATITEFIYVPDSVKDGSYLLNLQIAPFENDAAPVKPVLYLIV